MELEEPLQSLADALGSLNQIAPQEAEDLFIARKRAAERFREVAYAAGYDRGSFPPIW